MVRRDPDRDEFRNGTCGRSDWAIKLDKGGGGEEN